MSLKLQAFFYPVDIATAKPATPATRIPEVIHGCA